MLSEWLLSNVVRNRTDKYFSLEPATKLKMPEPDPEKKYSLYIHIPFCERLCPYCSFNCFTFKKDEGKLYFNSLHKELASLKNKHYNFESVYIGGGTPTVMMDELCETIDIVKDSFPIKSVSCETNPNHLTSKNLEMLNGRVDRLSVGVQSFDDSLLKQMDRYDKYGSGQEVFECLQEAKEHIPLLNVDMIFNFPAQTESMLRNDLERIIAAEAGQVSFYPLMASPSVKKALAETVGSVDYRREQKYYEIICDTLVENSNAPFHYGSAWTFNSVATDMIDEYIVDYDEYPAIGSGGFAFVGETLYVNTFSLKQYREAIESDRMPLLGIANFSKKDRMRYCFIMQLFGLSLDKKQFEKDFGCSIENGLPLEMAFMKANGAFERNTDKELTLTPKGRYLVVAMMRQFFIGVNKLRDQAKKAIKHEAHCC